MSQCGPAARSELSDIADYNDLQNTTNCVCGRSCLDSIKAKRAEKNPYSGITLTFREHWDVHMHNQARRWFYYPVVCWQHSFKVKHKVVPDDSFFLADALEISEPCKWKIIRNEVTKTVQKKLVCSVSIPSTLWEPQFLKPWRRQETLLSVWGYWFFPHWKEVLKPGRIETPTQDPACKTNGERLIPCELIHSVTECRPPPPIKSGSLQGSGTSGRVLPALSARLSCYAQGTQTVSQLPLPSFYFAPRIDKLYHFYTESVKNNSYQEPGFVWLCGENKYQNKSFKKQSSRSRLKSILFKNHFTLSLPLPHSYHNFLRSHVN